MSAQRTLASVAYDTNGKGTRRERFLREMDAVIPWPTLRALIAPHYTVPGRGRRPVPLETMLRVYFLQPWFDLSDPQTEDMLHDSKPMRRFARVDLGKDPVPDASTIPRFRHLLEQHQLTAAMFDAVNTLHTEKRLLLKAGTIVDATISAAPSSTGNATRTRDPEMKQTRKGTQWYFGMKVYAGTDTRGIVHSLTTTDAVQHDSTQLAQLLHGQDSVAYGDKAYDNADPKARGEAERGRYRVNKRGQRTAQRDAINAARSRRIRRARTPRLRSRTCISSGNGWCRRARSVGANGVRREKCAKHRTNTHQTAHPDAILRTHARLIGRHDFQRRPMHTGAELLLVV